MNLSVLERLLLLNALPQQGDLTTIKVVHRLREDLSFTEEEHVVLQFRVQDEQAQWLQDYGESVPVPDGMTREEAAAALSELNGGIEIDIGLKAAQIICEMLEKLNDEGSLTERHISLCEKFEITD
jgi:hypothetical protein